MKDTNKQESKYAMMLFDVWQDYMNEGKVPLCQRYEKDFLARYDVKDKFAPYYWLFMGFLGGLDMAAEATKREEAYTKMETLTEQQKDALLDLVETTLAVKEGFATEDSIINKINSISSENAEICAHILTALRHSN